MNEGATNRRLEASLKSTAGSGYQQIELGWRIFNGLAQAADHRFGWRKLPTPLGLAVLIGVRTSCASRTCTTRTSCRRRSGPVPPWRPEYRTPRTPDGTYNDLEHPAMGRAGSRFGRNMPLDTAHRETAPRRSWTRTRGPSAASCMTRTSSRPATTLNALAAAWLQFMIQDWFSHGRGPTDDVWEMPLAEDDPWPEHPMLIPRTPRRPDAARRAPTGPPTYLNTRDALVGRVVALRQRPASMQRRVRSGDDGKLHIGPDGLLAAARRPPSIDPRQVPGLLARPEHAGAAVRARAQRDLRPAQQATTRRGPTRSCSSGRG